MNISTHFVVYQCFYLLVTCLTQLDTLQLKTNRASNRNKEESSDALANIIIPSSTRPLNNVLYTATTNNAFQENNLINVYITSNAEVNETKEYSCFGLWNDSLNDTGWIHLSIQFNQSTSSKQDALKAYMSGVLEGYLSSHRLVEFYLNVKQLHEFKNDPNQAYKTVLHHMKLSLAYMKKLLNWNTSRPFNYGLRTSTGKLSILKQMWLILLQIYGIRDGYTAALQKKLVTGPSISIADLLLLSADGDFYNIKKALVDCEKNSISSNAVVPKEKKFTPPSRCSALIRLTSSDLFIGHTTWESYSEMTRIIKYYTFPFQNVASKVLVLSSYPGIVTSTDDFILTSQKLAIMETSLDINNQNILCDVNKSQQCWSAYSTDTFVIFSQCVVVKAPDFILSLAATRLASNGRRWSEILEQGLEYSQNLASYEWMIITYANFVPHVKPRRNSNLLMIVEVAPGILKIEDKSHVLAQKGYWASINEATFPKVRQWIGDSKKVERLMNKYVNKNQNLVLFFPQTNYQRQFLFSQGAKRIETLQDMQKMMQFSKVVPSSKTSFIKSIFSIAPRFDLYNGSHVFEGATDTKIVNAEMMRTLSFVGISGPQHEFDKPFVWPSNSQLRLGHRGLPEKWDFPWHLITNSSIQPFITNSLSKNLSKIDKFLIFKIEEYMKSA